VLQICYKLGLNTTQFTVAGSLGDHLHASFGYND